MTTNKKEFTLAGFPSGGHIITTSASRQSDGWPPAPATFTVMSGITTTEEEATEYERMVEAVREHYRPVKGVSAEKLRALGPKFVRLTYEHVVYSRAAEKLEGYEEGRLKALFYAALYEKLAYEEFKMRHQHRIICNSCGKPKRESLPVREWGAPMPATFERVYD